MAQKRMFDKTITNSDEFLDLPDSSQVLYFHLNMNADDDGFVNNWKSIIRMTGTKEDDLKILIAKSFVIPFDSGVIVIKHWRINNFLRKDRHIDTNYKQELSMLNTGENGEYKLLVNQWSTENRIEENSIDKNSIEENIYDYYQNEIGALTPRQYELMNDFIDKYGEEKIKEAINITCDNNVKTFNYFKSVLSNGNYKRKKVTEPEWLDKDNHGEEISDEELKQLEEEMSIFEN